MSKVNKSMQFTREDWINNLDIKSHNPLCENHSDALSEGFHDAHENGINFKAVAKHKFDNSRYDDVDPSEYSSKKSFLVESEDWDAVVDEFKKQLGVEKIRISYLARLVLSNYRMHLLKEEKPEEEVSIKTNTVDGVELLQKVNNYAAELIRAGKIEKVLAFIEEE